MNYDGNTQEISLAKASVNASLSDDIPPGFILPQSRNIYIHRGGIEPRGGTSKVNSSALTGGGAGLGGFDFRLYAGTQQNVVATADGKIWKNTTTTIKTGLNTSAVAAHFVAFRNTLYCSNGYDVPQTWDGAAASTSALANPAADWSGTNNPQQMIVRSNQLSKRILAVGFNGAASREYIYLSATNTDNFVTGVVKLAVDCSDGIGPVGAVEFGSQALIFSNFSTFYLDDTDPDTANWGVLRSQANLGAASFRLICKAENGVYTMMRNGVIGRIGTTNAYGDYQVQYLTDDDLNIKQWIQANVDLNYISKFHSIYDADIKAVRFFVVRNGQTTVDTSLNYNVYTGAWSIDGNYSYASGFSAACSFPYEESAGTFKIRTMDYSGYIWKLNQSSKADDGNAYWAGFRTSMLSDTGGAAGVRYDKYFRRLFPVVVPRGNYTLSIRKFADSTEQDVSYLSVVYGGAVYGSGIYGIGLYGGEESFENDYASLRYRAKRTQFEISTNTAGADWFIPKLLLDSEVLGGRPR
ncbi:MAG: hypothetical protein E6Q97_26535 [Desulfurellales bacterium]|nr:MAG: hypothetical protein E6Q97_26535 [Desulfurellales bacterium]